MKLGTKGMYVDWDAEGKTGWYHMVMSLSIIDDTRIGDYYVNGEHVTKRYASNTGGRSTGDGRVVVGRMKVDEDGDYGPYNVDELIMFNHLLTDKQVRAIYESY